MNGFRFWTLGFTAILMLVGTYAFAESSTRIFDLSGSWKLDRTENFETYLKESGTSWWKRKLAVLGSSSLRQSIKHEGNRFEIMSENPVETRTDVILADGETQRSVETAAGDMMTWIAHLDASALVVDGHGDLGHRIIRREIIEDSMVMTIFNPDANTECKLYFEREKSQ